MKNQKFDERQLWIRGNVFQHAFFAQVLLLLLNALITSNGVVWADNFYMNLILLFVPVVICSLELIFRDVYIQTKIRRAIIIGIFSAGALFGAIPRLVDLSKGESLWASGKLTHNGGGFVVSLLFAIIAGSLIIKTVMDKYAEQTE
ncbi:MAG: DUF799 domain-containing protein [Clostridiales Family XIII bacterium]|jgi:hypothetical protein|nr:DUF799 domain-containing protein [Clostridiales Family XIII bacterium]